jgi:hypothetical protein
MMAAVPVRRVAKAGPAQPPRLGRGGACSQGCTYGGNAVTCTPAQTTLGVRRGRCRQRAAFTAPGPREAACPLTAQIVARGEMAGASPGIAGPGNGERERGSRGRRSAAPGTYQTVCGELIPTTNRPRAAGSGPHRRGVDLLTRALPRCRHRPIGHPDRVRRPRHRSPTGQMTGGRSREARQVASASRRLCRHALRGRNESRQVPSLSRWTHENGSPSRLPITHHARRDPAFTQPDDPLRPLECRLHPARWSTKPAGTPPSPSPAAESVHVVAACRYRHRSPQRTGVSRPRFALFGRCDRPSPEKSAHSPLPGVS